MEENELKIIDRRIDVPEETKPETSKEIVLSAMNKGYSIDEIERLMELSERHQKNIAKQAFFEDFAKFKEEAPPVKKDRYNKFFDSWYTSLGNLLDTYNPILAKHGLSASFPTPEQDDSSMTGECRITHRLGHSESFKMKVPIDKAAIGGQSGKKSRNDIQDIKSTFTYLRSATFEAAIGVTGTEAGIVDDDGNAAGSQILNGEFISEDQLKKLTKLAKETKTLEAPFLKYLKVDELSVLPSKDYQKALNFLNSRKKKQK